MAVITTSIGTASRDYSTITAWEADLDNGAVYSASDDALGECYDDSAFNEAASVTLNGGGTIGLASCTLSVASGERHDGTAGTGARIVEDGTNRFFNPAPGVAGSYWLTMEWLELDHNQTAGAFGHILGTGAANNRIIRFQRLIIHGLRCTVNEQAGISSRTRDHLYQNLIIYDIHSTASNRDTFGLDIDGDENAGGCFNNTIADIEAHGTGLAAGFNIVTNSTQGDYRNNVAGDVTSGSGTALDFNFPGTSPDSDFNLSEDASADDGGGSNNLISQTYADLFVSTTAGSEDFHLKSGSPAIDQGEDLGTTPGGVNIDINGRDRDAEGDVWDMGAHEFVAVGGGRTTKNLRPWPLGMNRGVGIGMPGHGSS